VSDIPRPIEQFFEDPTGETARHVWSTEPQIVEQFVRSVAYDSDDWYHPFAAELIELLPPDSRWREAALQLLLSPEPLARRHAAIALAVHGDPTDAGALLQQAPRDSDDFVSEECLEQYACIAPEIDEAAVEEVFARPPGLWSSIVSVALAERRDTDLLPLIQREAALCEELAGDRDAALRFSLARWMLGEDGEGERMLTRGLDERVDLGIWLAVLEQFDHEVGIHSERVTPELCRAAAIAVAHRSSLEAYQLRNMIRTCRERGWHAS
jgi:hypothetical protein